MIYRVTTKETVNRYYSVVAENETQARQRLRVHFSDPAVLVPGTVELTGEESVTARRITAAAKLPESGNLAKEQGGE